MSDDIDLEEQVDELKSANREIELEREIVEKDTQLAQFRLVRDALSAEKYKNQYIDEFRAIVENHYKPFTRGETSLPNEADMYEKLRQVEIDLERILNFSAFHTKTIAAIAGGFSSGKSTFINSFFIEKTVELATGVNPSTVIPSYVVCENNTKITGYNSQGAPFDIQPDLYESLTHDTMKKINFDLRKIIPYITVSCPMNKEYFEHICLIDTPGYNPPPSIESAEKDRETAVAAVANANFLVWLIGLDQTGTIQQSDLDFLKQDTMPFGKNGKEGRDLYIVLNNKSGARIRANLEKIIVSCEKHLEAAGLSYTGLCAFDPTDSRRELYICRKTDFFDFLKSKNKPNANIDFIYDPLRDVLDSYLFYIRRDKALATARKNRLREFKNEYLKSIETVFSGFENQMDFGPIKKILRRLKTDVDEYIKVRHPETIESDFADLAKRVDTALIQNVLQLKAGIDNSGETYTDEIESVFSELKNQTGAVSFFEENLNRLEGLRKKFDACFAGISRHLGITAWKPLPPVLRKSYCGKCGTKLETVHKFCPKCNESTIWEEAK